MALPLVKLKAQRPDRLSHPWVFDNEVASGPDASATDFAPGGIVRILDSKGKASGVGYYNPKSKIAVRYLTRRGDAVINAGFWKSRISAALAYRKANCSEGNSLPPLYRLVHGEADGLPGLVVDIYGTFAVVQFLALGLEAWRQDIVAAIVEATSVRGVYERSDSAVRKLEGLEEATGVVYGDAPPDLLEIEDGGSVLLADVKNGGKTGLFLDQRHNQIFAARFAKGRHVINCFSYTGLFSLRAAVAGAASVTDIESSETFNKINEAQWERNGLSTPHTVLSQNVFDYLRQLERDKVQTDMIVLDPPAFTKNRASREGAARGYNEINRVALGLLKPGGILITCSCSHHLDAAEFREIVRAAGRDAGRTLRLVEQRGQPADHPVLMEAPESEYLKCLAISVL
jgi:23S rRNA (cytosine1962-C5)-methyltransferase